MLDYNTKNSILDELNSRASELKYLRHSQTSMALRNNIIEQRQKNVMEINKKALK